MKKFLQTQKAKNKMLVEVIKSKLYWISDEKAPKDVPNAFFFNIDDDLVYQGFYEDFGPLNIAKIWKYTTQINRILTQKEYSQNIFFHHTSTDYKKSSNACLLICAFSLIVLKKTADEAFEPFKHISFRAFRDASYGQCSYKCTILDCLRGLQYAMKLKWFDFKTFNLNEYQHYQKLQNGDLNWIIPNKFIAFSTPSQFSKDKYGNTLFTPKDYVPIFKKLHATGVVRLNTKTYDNSQFIQNGINHYELYFTDGTSPSKQIVQKFLEIAQNQSGALAVHCKAGLGRTGSLIACYAMKHYNFNAADFIGWIRLCRPGSILGPQQHFLLQTQKWLKNETVNSPIWKQISEKLDSKEVEKQLKSCSIKQVLMSEKQIHINSNGDIGQGQYLVAAKKKRINGKA